jgi:hypothetical protein
MKLFLSLILLCTAFGVNAQSTYIVKGKVLSAETGQPLQGASVFAQNTTIGTATDADGNYTIYLPNGGYDLVVTFTGHNSDSRRVTTGVEENKSVNFQLKQKEKEMVDVTVVASSEVKDGWEKYGSFFLDNFIGKTTNSKQCSIKNPEILKFFYSKRKNRLKVTAAEPLLIENKALGYTIKYALDSFTHEYATEISLYAGYPLFEEMAPANNEQLAQWTANRQAAYQGSILHFMRGVFNKDLKEQGFEIQFVIKNNDNETAIKVKDFYGALNYQRDDSTQTVLIRPNQLNVGVIYSKEKPAAGFVEANPDEPKAFQFSVLTFQPSDSITIEQNGYYYDQNDLAISAYWTWDKVADLLPYDYKPVIN